MNAQELLECAPRLSDLHRGYVILNNGDRGIIVPPGVFDKKIRPSVHATLAASKAAQSCTSKPRSFA